MSVQRHACWVGVAPAHEQGVCAAITSERDTASCFHGFADFLVLSVAGGCENAPL